MGCNFFTNGFRLNVGQVEVLIFIDGQMRCNLVGDAGISPFVGSQFQRCDYQSVPQPTCAFVGTISDFRDLEATIEPAHFEFVRTAATSPSGKPRRGTPFRRYHSSGLMVYAQRGLTAATKPKGVRLGLGYRMDVEAGTTTDIWAACWAETADRPRAGRESDETDAPWRSWVRG